MDDIEAVASVKERDDERAVDPGVGNWKRTQTEAGGQFARPEWVAPAHIDQVLVGEIELSEAANDAQQDRLHSTFPFAQNVGVNANAHCATPASVAPRRCRCHSGDRRTASGRTYT